MKAFCLILILVGVPLLSFSQSAQEPNAKPKSEESLPTQRQIVDLPLPKRGFRPKLTLQRTEQFVAGERGIAPFST